MKDRLTKINDILFNAHYHIREDDLYYQLSREDIIKLLDIIEPGLSDEIFKLR